MGKGKSRKYPDKPQNNRCFCQWYDNCYNVLTELCEGNPHNCIKTYYRRLASRSNTQINNGDYRRI